MTLQEEILIRENGYRLAHLDLLDVLEEVQNIIPTEARKIIIESICDQFKQKLQFRELTDFSVNERDVKG